MPAVAPSAALSTRLRLVRLQVTTGLLAMAMLLAGCGGAGDRGPRAVTLGVDACDYCHMAVGDERLAAQWVPASGPIAVFDEPGCLLAWLERNPGAEGRAYVAVAPGGEWVPADSAVYLAGAVRTGMGFDVIALASPAAAAGRAVDGEGEMMTWAELERKGVGDAHRH